MLDQKGFDGWANKYDTELDTLINQKGYPFEGYSDVQNCIINKIKSNVTTGLKILDMGFGTGRLTKKLYDLGCDIYGFDFSEQMIDIAHKKMPNAVLVKGCFEDGLPKEFKDIKFDYIVSTWAFHHINDEMKVSLIKNLRNNLLKNGKIIIGDVSFINREARDKCKENTGESFDSEEHYIIYDEFKVRLDFCDCSYKVMSPCAGVFVIGFK